MLEGLFSQLANSIPPSITAVPPIPSHKTQREPLQATDGGAVPLVPPVPSQKTKVETKSINFALSVADQQKILAYLSSIGETDQLMIDNLLSECSRDAKALSWIFSWADRLNLVNKRPKPQAVTCRSCTNFKCFNIHGGGAGTCRVGVWSAGYCRWANTEHQCVKHLKRDQAL